ncbi:MAG: cation diffusion facilitator family transporter [Hyphomicrobiales bacterium]|nr:cation diffusion facilitator family transporter [Hyphomicrobiales bacterium]
MVAGVNIAVAVAVVALKYMAYLETGSVALYSDALESIVNVVTAFATIAALYLSTRPADNHHQFGHHKAEYFAVVLEGTLILLAAFAIIREAAAVLSAPRALERASIGLVLSGLATLANGLWALALITHGRRQRSPALVATGWHLATDVATSVGVLVAVALAAATGWTILDPVIGIAVALYIVWAGARLIRESLSGLMDQAAEDDVANAIRIAIATSAKGAIEAHDIKTRVAGPVTFVEFHLVVPGGMTVAEAHDICDRVEAGIAEAVRGAEVLIHLEPEQEAKRTNAVVI